MASLFRRNFMQSKEDGDAGDRRIDSEHFVLKPELGRLSHFFGYNLIDIFPTKRRGLLDRLQTDGIKYIGCVFSKLG